jgi:hypothetical protein
MLCDSSLESNGFQTYYEKELGNPVVVACCLSSIRTGFDQNILMIYVIMTGNGKSDTRRSCLYNTRKFIIQRIHSDHLITFSE